MKTIFHVVKLSRLGALFCILVLASITITLVGVPPVSAHGTVDQHWDPPHPGTGNAIRFHSPIGQSFKPINPLFTGFAVYLENTAAAPRGMIMWLKSGSIAGSTVVTKAFTLAGLAPPGFINVDLDSPVAVTPGSDYVLQLAVMGADVRWYIDTTGANPYPDGTAITDGFVQASFDYMFKTYGMSDSVTARIRLGTIAGPVLGTATQAVPIQGFTWTHIDFAQFSVTPGGVYVLDLRYCSSIPRLFDFIIDSTDLYCSRWWWFFYNHGDFA